MQATRKLRSPLKWHGGKSYLARRIIARMPPHATYVESFCGGLSVLLNKSPAAREVAGDINADLIDFWRTLARDGDALKLMADATPYDADTFRYAQEYGGEEGPVMDALAFLVVNRFSRGGLGKDFAWSDRLRGKRRPGGPIPGDVNAWDTIREELPTIAARIRQVEFRRVPAIDLIRELDGPETLFYVDPPYLHATRTTRDAYAHELTDADHRALLDTLAACRGLALLSGYRNPLYDAALADWQRIEFSMPNHAGQGRTKQRRIECLWLNPAATSTGVLTP